MELYVKIVNGFQPLTISEKNSILKSWLDSLYISKIPMSKWRFSPVGRATGSATVVGSILLVLLVISLTTP